MKHQLSFFWPSILFSCFVITSAPVIAENLLEKDGEGYYHIWSPFKDHKSWKFIDGSPYHHGADEHAKDWNHTEEPTSDLGMPIYPVFEGQVIFVGEKEGIGKEVILWDNNKQFAVRYGHLCDIPETVKVDVSVSAGTLLGYVGKTETKLPHLHLVLYEIEENRDLSSFQNGWGPGPDAFSVGKKVKEAQKKLTELESLTKLKDIKDGAKNVVTLVEEAITSITDNADNSKLKLYEKHLTEAKEKLESIKKDIDSATDKETVVESAKNAKKIAEIAKIDFTCGTCVKNIARAISFAAPYKIDVEDGIDLTKRKHPIKSDCKDDGIKYSDNEELYVKGEQTNYNNQVLLNPGQRFVKTWTFENTGRPWDSNYEFYCDESNNSKCELSLEKTVNIVEEVEYNTHYILKVCMKAPIVPGIYKETWYLKRTDTDAPIKDKNGDVWAEICVGDSSNCSGYKVPDNPSDSSSHPTFVEMCGNDTTDCSFEDVEQGMWYSKAVTWLCENGIDTGNEDGTFGLTQKVSRAEFLRFVLKANKNNLKADYPPTDTNFSDVKKDHPDSGFIDFATKQKIVEGYSDGYFRPDQLLAREEAAKMVVNVTVEDPTKVEKLPCPKRYEDPILQNTRTQGKNTNTLWYCKFLANLDDKEIMTGKSSSLFGIGDKLEKAEAAIISCRVHALKSKKDMDKLCHN